VSLTPQCLPLRTEKVPTDCQHEIPRMRAAVDIVLVAPSVGEKVSDFAQRAHRLPAERWSSSVFPISTPYSGSF